MLKIEIISVGKIKASWIQSGITHYQKLISKFADLTFTQVKEGNSAQLPIGRVLREEGERLVSRLDSTSASYLLDVSGAKLDSEEFSKQLEKASAAGKKMQFIIGVPPGMLLQPGIHTQVDDAKTQSVLAYSICFPNTCFADMDATADFLKQIRGGKQITIIAINQGAQTISFPISLAGFAKAYDGAGIDPNTPTGQAARPQ